MKKTPFILSILFVVLVFVVVSMVFNGDEDLDVVSGNGRIEATEIGISAKVAGRVEEIYVREGDMVSAGDVVAKLDASTINSQLQQAKA
ncbi:biotin/lipoyl-binding protein, partial [Alteromonas abrolhosensis]